jgi:hypothetical protein
MKKQYERPALLTETFDVEDVITASGFLQNAANTIYDVIHDAIDFFTSTGGGNSGGEGGNSNP